MSVTQRPLYRSDQAVMRADVWDACDKTCHYCGVELHPLRTFCVDHVMPRCAGGDDHPDNLVPSCRHCNRRKGSNADLALCTRLNKPAGELPKGFAVRGEVLLDYRQRHNLTHSQLSKQVGIPIQTIREAEDGRYMHISLIARLARAMDIDHMLLLRDAECFRERLIVQGE